MSSSAYVNKKFKDLVLACVAKTELKLWERTFNDYNELNFQIKRYRVVSFDFRNDESMPIMVSLVAEGEKVAFVKASFDSESVLDAIEIILSVRDKIHDRMIARRNG